MFDRHGDVAAIQDKHHFYWKERPWFTRGSNVTVFDVDGVKVGLARGLDVVYPSYTQQLKDAELLFLSTMAVDDVMFECAKVLAIENQCYVAMSSFMGRYVGMDFVGNAAVIAPDYYLARGMKAVHQPRVVRHLTTEGVLEAEMNVEYIRTIKRAYPMNDL